MIESALIGHLLVGFMTIIFIIVHDMRGVEFEPKYFDVETIFAMLIVFVCGYLSPLLVWMAWLSETRETRKRKYRITRLLYKLSNIGIKR